MEHLHDVHKAQLVRFSQWFAQRRGRACSDRDAELEDFKSDRLVDEAAIFNYADVETLLNDYHLQVIGRFREELESTTNLSAVFIAQLLAQAEGSGFALQVEDISAIEDQNRVGQISALTALPPLTSLPALASMPPLKPKAQLGSMLPPAGGAGNNVQLLQQIQDLEEDKRQMTDRMARVEMELTNLSRERSALSQEMQRLHQGHAATGDAASMQTAEYHRQLMEKQGECDAMRLELGVRLAESAQFRQLKDLLQHKNQEVKVLKQTLVNAGLLHEDGGGGVELTADDD